MTALTLPTGLDLVFATGGTGGHIYPALAVARAAQARGLRVGFLGQAGGMESRLVPEAGFPFAGVAAGKWDRQRPDPRQALGVLRGVTSAVRMVRQVQPGGVVGFGGFASFPGCLAAVLAGCPLALHEGNAFPSRVNRWFAGRARLVVVAFAEAGARLGGGARLSGGERFGGGERLGGDGRLVGGARRGGATPVAVLPFPVREVRVDRATARQRYGLPENAVVTLVMGGSQGSQALNRAVPDAFERLVVDAGREHHVLHSSGPMWIDDVQRRVGQHDAYHAHPYLDAAAAWAGADLAITRAGIGTLSEAAFHSVPLLMVPLPTAADDHQRFNARAVESAGAGLIVEESSLPDRLPTAWSELLEPSRRARMAAAAAARSPAGAAEAIADALIEALLGKPLATTRQGGTP